MASSEPTSVVCGYELVRWLNQPRTALCRADGQRLVVLKQLDGDCLLDGNLHPSIRERLARIRELAHGHVATLISVERDTEGRVYCVWEYVEGTDIETWCSDPDRAPQQAVRMLRELLLAVEALHGLGIIHGALHGGNAMVDARGELRLLDLSPLLFHEPKVDVDALGELICRILEQRGEGESEIGRVLLQHVARQDGLRELSASISRSMEARCGVPDASADQEKQDEQIRRRSLRWGLICAGAAVLLALVGGWGISRYYSPTAIPQEAPAEAMKAR
jgi:serine/threonine protein kinase